MAKLTAVNRTTQSLTPRERTKRHIPCAFLDDGRCSIRSHFDRSGALIAIPSGFALSPYPERRAPFESPSAGRT